MRDKGNYSKQSKWSTGNLATRRDDTIHIIIRTMGMSATNANMNNATAAESTATLKHSLARCSFDRLRTMYRDAGKLLKETLRISSRALVTDAEMDSDRDAARKKMEAHLGALPVERRIKKYRKKLFRQMELMGGMHVLFSEGRGGGDHGVSQTFAYSYGFTAVGGKEILLQNVHRSMDKIISHVFNCLYKRHNDGHPLAHGHVW